MNELVQKAEELAAAFGVGLKDLGEYIESHVRNHPLPSHTAPLTPAAPVTVVVGSAPVESPTEVDPNKSTEPQTTGEGQ